MKGDDVVGALLIMAIVTGVFVAAYVGTERQPAELHPSGQCRPPDPGLRCALAASRNPGSGARP